MRFLFADKILEIEKNSRIKGIKQISFEEGFLNPLSPETGYLPRLLMMECAAQFVSWLILYSTNFQKIPLIAAIEFAEIKESVRCGESIFVEITIESINSEGAVVNSVITKEERVIAKGSRCLCTLVDSKKLMDMKNIRARFSELSREARVKE